MISQTLGSNYFAFSTVFPGPEEIFFQIYWLPWGFPNLGIQDSPEITHFLDLSYRPYSVFLLYQWQKVGSKLGHGPWCLCLWWFLQFLGFFPLFHKAIFLMHSISSEINHKCTLPQKIRLAEHDRNQTGNANLVSTTYKYGLYLVLLDIKNYWGLWIHGVGASWSGLWMS